MPIVVKKAEARRRSRREPSPRALEEKAATRDAQRGGAQNPRGENGDGDARTARAQTSLSPKKRAHAAMPATTAR